MHERSTKFWKPGTDFSSILSEDRSDIDPLSSTSYIHNHMSTCSLAQQRRSLPVFQLRNHILYLLDQFQTLILVGETGSGKSTQVPQYVHEAGWTGDGRLVGVVEPRRVAAVTLASRVADESGCVLGSLVGYCVRFDERVDARTTRIKFMTDGILIREMMADPLLSRYAVIVVDEVHERGVTTDITLALMRKILRRRRDLRLVLCSATLDADRFQQFFNLAGKQTCERGETGNGGLATATVLHVSGRQFPVDVFYSTEPVTDYLSASVETAWSIHSRQPPGDILVFLTGQEEVDEAVSRLEQLEQQQKKKSKKEQSLSLLVLPLYGSLPAREQRRVFERAPIGHRKAVVATNLAEASVTIAGVSYVVDCGFVKLRWRDSRSQLESLVVCAASKSSATQRSGRAGRQRSGQAYRLYTEEQWRHLPEYTVPEVSRISLASCLLQLRALGVDNVVRFHMPTQPPARSLLLAVEQLFALGAIDMDSALTPFGSRLAELPLTPSLGALLLKAEQHGCTEQAATLVAMLQVERCFIVPGGGEALLRARHAHRTFQAAEGDLLTLLNVYEAFIRHSSSRQWCSRMFVNYKAIARAREIRERIERQLQRFGVELSSCDGRAEAVLRCIASGLFMNAAYRHYSGEYRSARGGDTVLSIHPSSILYRQQQQKQGAVPPDWVVYVDLVQTSRVYMKDITVIRSEWLTELAPHYYHVTTVRDR